MYYRHFLLLKRHSKKLVFLGGLVALVLVLKVSLDVFPISLQRYIPLVEKELPANMGIGLTRPVLTWTFWTRPFEVVIHDVRVWHDEKGPARCARASRAGVLFSLWSLLAYKKLIPTSVRIDNLRYVDQDCGEESDEEEYTLKGPANLLKRASSQKGSLSWLKTYRDPCSVHLIGKGYRLSVDYTWSKEQALFSGRGRIFFKTFLTNTPLENFNSMLLEGTFDLACAHGTDDWNGAFIIAGTSPKKQKIAANVIVSPQAITLKKAFLKGPFIEATLEGKLDLKNNHPYTLSVKTPYINFANILTVWPGKQGQQARAWLVQNTSKAQVRADISLKGLLDDVGRVDPSLNGQLLFKNLMLIPVDGFAPIKKLKGRAHFDKKSFDIDITGGKLKGQKLTKGRVRIKGLDGEQENISIQGSFEGGIQDALSLIGRQPFNYLSKVKIPLDTLKGNVKTHIELSFPLVRELKKSEVVYKIFAQMSDASYSYGLPFLAEPLSFSKGALNLDVSSKGLKLEGDSACLGEKVSLNLQQDFSKKEHTSLTIKTSMTERHISLMSWGALKNKLPAPFDLQVVYDTQTPFAWHVEVDWTKNKLFSGDIQKDPGVPAFLNFDLDLEGGVSFKNIRATLSDVSVEGHLARDKAGDFRGFSMKAKPNSHHDWTVTVDKIENGFSIDVRGHRLAAWWLMPLLKASASDNAGDFLSEPIDVRLTGRIDRLNLHKKSSQYSFLNFSIDAQGIIKEGDVFFNKFHTSAKTLPMKKGGHGVMTVERMRDSHNVTWKAKATNAGYFLEGLQLLPDIHEGKLDLVLKAPQGSSVFKGDVRLDNFAIKRTPFLQRFFMTFLSLPGFLRLLTGNYMSFSDLKGQFTLRKKVLDLSRLTMEGDTTLIMQGWIDFKRERVTIHGDIIPAYFLNRFLTNIPIVGPVVFGGKDDGLFATRYYVEGPFNDLKVKANPLRMFTPGLFKLHNRMLETESLKRGVPKG